MKFYTKEEQRILMLNPFVLYIKDNRAIIYEPIFKLWCVFNKKYNPEKTCRNLFSSCEFDLNILSERQPYERIRRWEELFDLYGYEYFLEKQKVADKQNQFLEKVNKNKKTIYNLELRNAIKKEVEFYVKSYKK